MTGHRYTVGLLHDLSHLLSVFTTHVRAVEWRHAVATDPACDRPHPGAGSWGSSWLADAAFRHAQATAETVVWQWHTLTDPREPADERIGALVRDAWLTALSFPDTVPGLETFGADVLPAGVEERPTAIPRVAGVRYFPAYVIASVVPVPEGYDVAVAVRHEHADGIAAGTRLPETARG
ncbi:MAG TPA: hypothetical protein VFY86_10940 [Nocardioides sp.]|jgi:hypothetical protein|nr:hypothetical protein [uncultured Nocardioides sp.]HEX5987028.1 hypothetical protein [Nocardioides sp.]